MWGGGVGLLLPECLSFCPGMLMSHQLVHSLNERVQMPYSAAPRVTLSSHVCMCVCPPLSEPQVHFPSCTGLGLHAQASVLAGTCLPVCPQPLERMCEIPRTKAGGEAGEVS